MTLYLSAPQNLLYFSLFPPFSRIYLQIYKFIRHLMIMELFKFFKAVPHQIF